jgi:hypothetical protein
MAVSLGILGKQFNELLVVNLDENDPIGAIIALQYI